MRITTRFKIFKSQLTHYNNQSYHLYQLSKCNSISIVSSKRFKSSSAKIEEKFPNLEEICNSGVLPKYFNFSRDVFDRHVIADPSRTALIFENENWRQEWRFSEVKKDSIKMAITLQNLLLQNCKSDRPILLVILPRVPEWWSLYLGSIRIGAVFTPGTTLLTPKDIAYRLRASGAAGVITNEANQDKVDKALEINAGFKPLDNLKKILVRSRSGSGSSSPSPNMTKKNNWLDLNEFYQKVDENEISTFECEQTGSNELAQIFFTSGTTGSPKMVGHSHSSYGIGHWKTASVMGLRDDDIFWNISDTGWAKSSYGNFFAPWIAGSTVYIHQMEKFETGKVLEILRTRPISGFCAPPTLYRALVLEKDPNAFRFKNVRYCVGGGEAVDQELSKIWKEKTGFRIHEIYGQTETTMIAGSHTDPPKAGSIGRISTFDLKIINDKFEQVPRGQEGIVALQVKPHRPVGLFLGYLKESVDGALPEVDEGHPSFGGDYYAFGDRALMDSEGYLFHLGRSDDVIISAGYRIGPFEVESALQGHHSVAESACVSSPDPIRGSVVKAFIVLKEEYKNASASEFEKLKLEIQNYVKSVTAPYKYPRKVEFVDHLPKTISGKILRRELRKQEYEK